MASPPHRSRSRRLVEGQRQRDAAAAAAATATLTKREITMGKILNATLHVHKSKSNSSKRTRAASVASLVNGSKGRKSKKRSGKKSKKLNEVLIDISTATNCKISREEIDDKLIFADGGVHNNHRINPKYSGDKNVRILSIRDGDLFVPTDHYGKGDKGLRHREYNITSLVLCPRNESLDELKVLYHPDLPQQLSNGYAACIKEANDIKRGKGITIQCEDSFKYACVGSATIKNEKGCRPLHNVMAKLKEEVQSILIQHVRSVERLFEKYMETSVISNVREGIKLVNAPLLQNTAGEEASIYQSFAVGRNIYLSCHIDKDFIYSAATVVHREVKDEVIAYFNFPRLGLAIPLKPFDVLFFNPNEPHMISSRCHDDDDVFCLSFYLKTALMGGNNNDLELTVEQKECLKVYEQIFEETKTK